MGSEGQQAGLVVAWGARAPRPLHVLGHRSLVRRSSEVSWSHESIVLSCGCEAVIGWDDAWVGKEWPCKKHGEVVVEVMHRVYESSGSKDYQLGVTDEDHSDSEPRA